MKKISFLIFCLLFTVNSFAQQGINYKALIKDANNAVVANQSITVEFTILQGVAQTNVYQETHNPTTDANGIIIVNIGEGTVVSGVFDDIAWASDDHFLNTQINTGAGLVDLGTTGFTSVPYALSAKTAANVTGLETIDEGNGNGLVRVGRDPDFYDNIGENAVDLSSTTFSNNIYGATGQYSVAMGVETRASGVVATAMGELTNASGGAATAMGGQTEASGLYSTAMGNGSQASGLYSTAMGNGSQASGLNSTAMGRDTEASGEGATAMGRGTEASGLNSTAMGYFTTASADYSTVIGSFNVGGGIPFTTSVTDPLFEIGNGSPGFQSNALTVLRNGTITAPSFNLSEITDAKALITKEYADANLANSGLESIVEGNGSGLVKVGRDPANYGDVGGNAVDLSYSNIISSTRGATGQYSTAMGFRTVASGAYSTAMGQQTRASGSQSTAMGIFTEASGTTSTAMGNSTIASGLASTAMGGATTASGNYSTAMGNGTTASGDTSTAIGQGTRASGNFSTAMGFNTRAEAGFSTAIGYYNVGGGSPATAVGTDPLFEIGNGTNASFRRNALTVLKNGTITAPSFDLSEITNAKALVTKEYVDGTPLAFPFNSSFENFGFDWADVTYLRANSRVFLEGLARRTGVSSVLGTLPVGYRPAKRLIFTCEASIGQIRVDIMTNGEVIYVFNTAIEWINLSGINFRVN